MCSENLRLDTITVIKQRQMKMLLFKFMEFSKNNKNSLFIYRSITNTWSNIFASLFRKTMRTKYYEMFHSLSLYRCRVQKAKKIKQNKKICGRISTTVRALLLLIVIIYRFCPWFGYYFYKRTMVWYKSIL